jgi:hypothetical protein
MTRMHACKIPGPGQIKATCSHACALIRSPFFIFIGQEGKTPTAYILKMNYVQERSKKEKTEKEKNHT